jgi:BirA family biotin operon repressor/biotin-[acetyl-CoA-carboxylase] ligase
MLDRGGVNWDRAALERSLGVPVVLHAAVDSTMDVAAEDPRAPVVHLAVEQRRGQGRHGRSWASPPGNLYATVAWPERGEPWPPAFLAAIQVAWAEAIVAVGGPAVRCKWPNDGMVGGGKWSGLLARRVAEGGPRLLVGLGANLDHAPRIDDPENALPATALRDHWTPWPGGGMVGALLLKAAIEVLRQGPEAVVQRLERWPRYDALEVGEELRVDLPGGERRGRYLGLAPDGCLRLEAGGAESLIAVGEARAVRLIQSGRRS